MNSVAVPAGLQRAIASRLAPAGSLGWRVAWAVIVAWRCFWSSSPPGLLRLAESHEDIGTYSKMSSITSKGQERA